MNRKDQCVFQSSLFPLKEHRTTSIHLDGDAKIQEEKQGLATFVVIACQLTCLLLAIWTVIIIHDVWTGFCFIAVVIGPEKAKELLTFFKPG